MPIPPGGCCIPGRGGCPPIPPAGWPGMPILPGGCCIPGRGVVPSSGTGMPVGRAEPARRCLLASALHGALFFCIFALASASMRPLGRSARAERVRPRAPRELLQPASGSGSGAVDFDRLRASLGVTWVADPRALTLPIPRLSSHSSSSAGREPNSEADSSTEGARPSPDFESGDVPTSPRS